MTRRDGKAACHWAPTATHAHAERAFELALLNSREYQTQLEQLYLGPRGDVEPVRVPDPVVPAEPTAYTSAAGEPVRDEHAEFEFQLRVRADIRAGGQLIVDLPTVSSSNTWATAGPPSAATFVQLRPATLATPGRVRLEQLTQGERDVLYAARDFYRFRKQFWASVTTTGGGYLSLLLQVQTIRNAESNRFGQEQNLRLHEELFRGGKKSIVEVDQAFQGFLQSRLDVTTSEVNLQTALDQFKLGLGLPPRIPVVLDDAPLKPFVLTDPKLDAVRDEVENFQKARNRDIDAPPPLNDLRQQYVEFEALTGRLEPFIAAVAAELADWGQHLPTGDDDPARRARAANNQFRETFPETAGDLTKFREAAGTDAAELAQWMRGANPAARVALLGGLGATTGDIVRSKAGWDALVVHTRKCCR